MFFVIGLQLKAFGFPLFSGKRYDCIKFTFISAMLKAFAPAPLGDQT